MGVLELVKSLNCDRFERLAPDFLAREYQANRASINPVFTHHFLAVAKWWVLDEPEEFNWLIGGDCPFLSVGGDFADNPIEAIAIYAHELRRWARNVGAGRRDPRIIRELGTWKPIETLTHEYLEWFSPREGYCTWHFVPNHEDQIRRPDIRAEYERAGVLPVT